MIVLAATIQDANGVIELPNVTAASGAPQVVPRVSRTPALDGESLVETRGTFHSDSTISITINGFSSQAHKQSLDRFVETHNTVNCYSTHGAFQGVINSYQPNGSGATLSILVVKKIS